MHGRSMAIRVDASTAIGTGHFMRCLTLADSWRRRGGRTRFVCRHLPVHFQRDLLAEGHELRIVEHGAAALPADGLAHAHWLGASQAQDAAECQVLLADQPWDWIVVDHYALDCRWEGALRGPGRRILVIDDIADRRHDCDMLLDQNLFADAQLRYRDLVPAHCLMLLGPGYALLRDAFARLHVATRLRSGAVRRLLVFLGGVDADNFTGRVILALQQLPKPGLQVDVVIGQQHRCRAQIEADCSRLGFVCHVQTTRMAELMAQADLAIGAGGSASWERCCLGLPTLLVALADNQVEISAGLDRVGAGRYLGTPASVDVASIRDAVLQCCRQPEQAWAWSARSHGLVDGCGVDRILAEMDALPCISAS